MSGGAHPRSRGEHERIARTRNLPLGSSPLARGTQGKTLELSASLGLIPARAGNTNLRGSTTTDTGAHPRSRGEHHLPTGRSASRKGSSPLARGTHLLTWGFTPYTSKIESLWSQSLHPEYTISNHY